MEHGVRGPNVDLGEERPPARKADLLRILGPLDVLSEGRPVPVAGARQRALLALLALRANELVTVDELTDALFQRGGTGALHTAISRLRGVLGAEWIETHPNGYALRADAERLDAIRAREAASRAASVDDLTARREALCDVEALWRGSVLAGMDLPPSFRADAQRLDELRRALIADRIEADLALGRHADVVAELDALKRAYPFDERTHRQHALALYRTGRQAEALSALRGYRATLRDELGLEPSAELRDLERAILNHDPALHVPEPARRPGANVPPRRPRFRRRLAVLAIAGAAAASIVAVIASRPHSGGVAFDALRPGTLAIGGVDSFRAERVYDVGRVPRAIAVGYGAAWVANFTDQTVARIDDDGGVMTTGLGVTPTGLAVGASAVWVLAGDAGTVIRLEPSTGRILGSVRLRPGLTDIAVGQASVWVTNSRAGTVTRIDARRSEPVVTLSRFAGPAGVDVVRDTVWVAEQLGRRLTRIDARRAAVADRIALDLPPGDIAATEGAVWATSGPASAVMRVDARTRTARLISVGRFPSTIAAGSGRLAAINELDHSVSIIDVRTAKVLRTLRLSDPITQRPRQITPGGIAIHDGRLWLTVQSY